MKLAAFGLILSGLSLYWLSGGADVAALSGIDLPQISGVLITVGIVLLTLRHGRSTTSEVAVRQAAPDRQQTGDRKFKIRVTDI